MTRSAIALLALALVAAAPAPAAAQSQSEAGTLTCQLKPTIGLIIGHTDAVGGRETNLELSQRRAEAIRDALINPFGIVPQRIEAVGLGEEQLLNRRDPQAAENRRVQLINIGR